MDLEHFTTSMEISADFLIRQKRELPHDAPNNPRCAPLQESKSAHHKSSMAMFTAAVHNSQEMGSPDVYQPMGE